MVHVQLHVYTVYTLVDVLSRYSRAPSNVLPGTAKSAPARMQGLCLAL